MEIVLGLLLLLMICAAAWRFSGNTKRKLDRNFHELEKIYGEFKDAGYVIDFKCDGFRNNGVAFDEAKKTVLLSTQGEVFTLHRDRIARVEAVVRSPMSELIVVTNDEPANTIVVQIMGTHAAGKVADAVERM